MTMENNFNHCASHFSAHVPPQSATAKILAAQTFSVQPPVRAGDYEVHVFKAHDKKATPATADDVVFASPVSMFGGLEQDDMDAFKDADQRAEDALYSAQKSGRDVCVVVFDMNSGTRPSALPARNTEAQTKVLDVGAYEVHVHYPRGCSEKSLREDKLHIQDIIGMTAPKTMRPIT